MTCPVCGGKSKVEKSCSDTETIYRRRSCQECGYVFYTTESESTSDGFYKTMLENHPSYKRPYKRARLSVTAERI